METISIILRCLHVWRNALPREFSIFLQYLLGIRYQNVENFRFITAGLVLRGRSEGGGGGSRLGFNYLFTHLKTSGALKYSSLWLEKFKPSREPTVLYVLTASFCRSGAPVESLFVWMTRISLEIRSCFRFDLYMCSSKGVSFAGYRNGWCVRCAQRNCSQWLIDVQLILQIMHNKPDSAVYISFKPCSWRFAAVQFWTGLLHPLKWIMFIENNITKN